MEQCKQGLSLLNQYQLSSLTKIVFPLLDASQRKRKMKQKPIYFYDKDKPYYQFTNFYCDQPIVIDEKQWRTTEHYFQAQKFIGTPYVEFIARLDKPRDAFNFSRNPLVSKWRRPDWEDVKQFVMYKALLAKFTQNVELRQLLASTGNRKLVEHSPHDGYWGDGKDGKGHNHLGRLLMKVREHISVKHESEDDWSCSTSSPEYDIDDRNNERVGSTVTTAKEPHSHCSYCSKKQIADEHFSECTCLIYYYSNYTPDSVNVVSCDDNEVVDRLGDCRVSMDDNS